eukprot:COSAG05_NODE_9296_length_634_cov_0.747664_1_plen_158_part_10
MAAAVSTARELKAAGSGSILVAEALLSDARRIFPQKHTFVLHWLVDVLIRAQKSGSAVVRKTQYWRLLAALVPCLPPTVEVHPGLAFPLAAAFEPAEGADVDAGETWELLRHGGYVLSGLSNFHPRIDGLSAIVASLSSLISCAHSEHLSKRALALRV